MQGAPIALIVHLQRSAITQYQRIVDIGQVGNQAGQGFQLATQLTNDLTGKPFAVCFAAGTQRFQFAALTVVIDIGQRSVDCEQHQAQRRDDFPAQAEKVFKAATKAWHALI